MVHLSGKTEKPTKEDFKKLNSTEKEWSIIQVARKQKVIGSKTTTGNLLIFNTIQKLQKDKLRKLKDLIEKRMSNIDLKNLHLN